MRARLRPLLLAGLFLLTACNPLTPNSSSTPTPPPLAIPPTLVLPTTTAAPRAIEATPDSTPQAADTVSPATEAQVRRIEEQAAAMRGLKPKTDVPEHFISGATMKNNLKAELAQDYPAAEAQQDSLELWLLRLVDRRDIDLYQLQVDLLGEQVLGYYNHKKNELFVRNDQQPLDPEAQMTLAHEFTHSLQDEYYDLEKLQPEHSNDSDRNAGARSLIEGDATISGILFAQKHLTAEEFQQIVSGSASASTTQLDNAPLIIRESLTFPYDSGVKFTLELYKAGGWPAVDRALQDPPTSTEQILHPAKYRTLPRDEPLPVTMPPLTSTLGTGWTLRETDTMGEFDLGALLRTHKVDDPAATEGWGGARYVLYRNDTDAVMVLRTRWDKAADPREFDAALRRSLASAQQQTVDSWEEGGRFYAIHTSAENVDFVSSTSHTAVEVVIAALK